MRAAAFFASVIALFLVLVAPPSSAFCRRTTAGGDEAYDAAPTGRCAGQGALPLFWTQSCIAVHVSADDGTLDVGRAGALVARAAADWAAVRCAANAGATIRFVDTPAACGAAGRAEIHFATEPVVDGLLAVTETSFDANDGVISRTQTTVYALGADASDDAIARVVRHELGHVLGLAHSQDTSAVMFAGYDPARPSALAADDAAALCDAYGPDRPVGAGCTAAPGSPGAGALVVVALALLVARRRHGLLAGAAVLLASATASAAPPKRPPPKKPPPVEPARDAPSSTTWLLGVRYRASILPQALVGLVAQDNPDLLFHSVGVELESRSERLAWVYALTYADLSTGDLLVGRRGSDLASAFNDVRSDRKAVAASVALLWSVPAGRAIAFELGVELGGAFTFGSFTDVWVHESADGPLALGGRRFAPCRTVNDGFGCRPQDHADPMPIRVGDHRERSMLEGGRAPTLLPWVTLPLVGARFRLGDALAARIGAGASLTGIQLGVALAAVVGRPK